MTPPDLSILAWGALVVGAAIIGLSKAALPGAATLAVALFAAVLPARQSTGTILLLLIVGDVFALWAYRRHADLRTLVRLAPAVIVGLVGGAVFLALASDTWVRRMIAVILLTVVAVTLIRRRAHTEAAERGPRAHRVAAAVYGSLGGFTTMVANAAGPVMSMYFIAGRFPIKAFLGTTAWFFAIVNVTKLPFSIGLGLITVEGLWIDLLLVPVVVAAAFFGRWIAGRISQKVFERVVIVLTIVGALYLLF
ncbi:sulfite exporter TauE/SafE family protein [Microbacterium protaetiae]|uniref:Probable membrane transporter protein n=1 Tax=Microbacterium protaetiae TaxID=2509458 RepID=A0A4P6EC47_9MICO|nr:sulfite exporter TauE/SafE family protein [Microbacterium protaetiae]QAY59186.1 sulfite exporter TauE/SafE family protein [Microbacterium protaetiae]